MKQTLTIRVGKEQLKKLRETAKAEDRSLSAVVRRFIDEGYRQINTSKAQGSVKI